MAQYPGVSIRPHAKVRTERLAAAAPEKHRGDFYATAIRSSSRWGSICRSSSSTLGRAQGKFRVTAVYSSSSRCGSTRRSSSGRRSRGPVPCGRYPQQWQQQLGSTRSSGSSTGSTGEQMGALFLPGQQMEQHLQQQQQHRWDERRESSFDRYVQEEQQIGSSRTSSSSSTRKITCHRYPQQQQQQQMEHLFQQRTRITT